MEFAFAGVHQLCAPVVARLEQLPGPQRDALGAAFGVREGDAPDRFLVGLALLSLLSAAAEERPLICIVDDAQWLDDASAQALAFVARRLGAEAVGLVFAARESTGERRFDGLAELVVGGLDDADARALLESAVAGPLDKRVLDRIIAETRGNPLALLELPRGRTPAELAGGFGLDRGPPWRAASRSASANEPPRFRRRRSCSCSSRRPSPWAIRCSCGRPPPSWGSRRARPPRRRRRASSSSVRRCASATRSCARRSTTRPRRTSAGGSTSRWPRPPTPRPIPIAARGTAPRRRRGSTRMSPPSWSARPAGRGRGAGWRRSPRSTSALPS